MTQLRIGIYPGTFDPITNGHADIIRRAIRIVDRLVIGVARNDGKGPLFATDERVRSSGERSPISRTAASERVEVRAFDTLLVNFAQSVGANWSSAGCARSRIRIRVQMAGMNARLNPRSETVF
jgi:pantetheine-phosphate adenylyltransferase